MRSENPSEAPLAISINMSILLFILSIEKLVQIFLMHSYFFHTTTMVEGFVKSYVEENKPRNPLTDSLMSSDSDWTDVSCSIIFPTFIDLDDLGERS